MAELKINDQTWQRVSVPGVSHDEEFVRVVTSEQSAVRLPQSEVNLDI